MAEQGPTPDIPCMNLTVAATGVYRFKVQGYSATKDMATKADQYYESDAFSAGGYDWAVRYYPRDFTRSRVVVCLVLLRRDGPLFGEFLPVTFGCTPLGKSGEPSAKMEQASSSTVHLGDDDDAVEVISHFIGYNDLQKFVRRDCFVLQCSISVLKWPKDA